MSEAPHIHTLLGGLDGFLNSDEELVQFARSGCEAAFVELWHRHSSTVFRAVFRIMKNREDAEDLVQETFLKAFAHLQSFNGASKFSTWLVRIGINAALGELRRRRSRPEASFDGMNSDDCEWHREIPDKAIDIEAQLVRSEMIEWMNTAIDRLHPSLRTVVEMQHRHDYSQNEIALLANLSVGAVKSRLSRARRTLREQYI
jgi:RNA polymerase sigma-70 factor (ECF subfamily)